MNHRRPASFVVLLVALFCTIDTYAQDDLHIWRDFAGALRAGKMSVERIRPLAQLGDPFKPILMGFLDSLRAWASPADWEATPEIFRVDDRIQYILPWTERNRKVTYCFSLLSDGARWYFQHLECIFIRLDTVSKCPTSSFPDVPEHMKNLGTRRNLLVVCRSQRLPPRHRRSRKASSAELTQGRRWLLRWCPNLGTVCSPAQSIRSLSVLGAGKSQR